MNTWISVDEKLPPSGEEVIVAVCDESGDTPWKYTASGMMAVKDVWIVDKNIIHSVTHWMPFPSYPSEKEVYKPKLYIKEYEFFTCSNCGYDIPSWANSMEEAKYLLEKGIHHHFCPSCKIDLRKNKNGERK